MQDYFKTNIDSKKNRDCCIYILKCNKVARFYKVVRLNNKVYIKTTDCAAWS